MVGLLPVPVMVYVLPAWDVTFTFFPLVVKLTLSVIFECNSRVSPFRTEPLAYAAEMVK
jgi:hypothetical protein